MEQWRQIRMEVEEEDEEPEVEDDSAAIASRLLLEL